MNKFEWEDHATKQPFNGDALRVLWRYQHHADSETLITYPGIRQIASDTNISVERVGRFRRELLDAGWLVKTAEKTPSGEAKLRLALGEYISNDTYLGQAGKKMNKKSKENLVPAAKQKRDERVKRMIERNMESSASLESPDSACLENAEATCLENAENEVSNIQTEQSRTTITRTTNNNQRSSSVVPPDSSPSFNSSVREESTTIGTSLNSLSTPLPAVGGTYEDSLNLQDFAELSLTYERLDYNHLANHEEVWTLTKTESEAANQAEAWLGEDKEWFERHGQRVPGNWLNKSRDERKRFKQEYEWALEWSQQ